jgi:hypothetical protein
MGMDSFELYISNWSLGAETVPSNEHCSVKAQLVGTSVGLMTVHTLVQ